MLCAQPVLPVPRLVPLPMQCRAQISCTGSWDSAHTKQNFSLFVHSQSSALGPHWTHTARLCSLSCRSDINQLLMNCGWVAPLSNTASVTYTWWIGGLRESPVPPCTTRIFSYLGDLPHIRFLCLSWSDIWGIMTIWVVLNYGLFFCHKITCTSTSTKAHGFCHAEHHRGSLLGNSLSTEIQSYASDTWIVFYVMHESIKTFENRNYNHSKPHKKLCCSIANIKRRIWLQDPSSLLNLGAFSCSVEICSGLSEPWS